MDRPRLGHDTAEPACDTAETWATTPPKGLRYGRPTRKGKQRAHEGLAAAGECRDTKFYVMVEGQRWCRDTAQPGLRYNVATRQQRAATRLKIRSGARATQRIVRTAGSWVAIQQLYRG